MVSLPDAAAGSSVLWAMKTMPASAAPTTKWGLWTLRMWVRVVAKKGNDGWEVEKNLSFRIMRIIFVKLLVLGFL
jgi:hypothetical protein